MYSVGGYHHEFVDSGYSFHFDDLLEPLADAYYLNCNAGGGADCVPRQGHQYRYGVDFINVRNFVDFGREQYGQEEG